ncbi:hypothetical protein Tco_0725020 [Tanacetum coccineum]|uniref:Uncharacterized protein n=1 Tax=Tanacetum coccineum TaxID=301880 RepID=A0ABQ4YBP8_9ASTR
MATSVILISSDSSEESVGTPTAKIILFGTIPTTIPSTAPTVDLPIIHDDTPLIPTNTPTISTIVPIIPIIPHIAPTIQYTSSFICTDSFDSDTPDIPPSQDPYKVTVAWWRSRVAARSSLSLPPIRQILPSPPGLPRRPAILVLQGQPIPVADYSSLDHFTLDDSSRDSPSNSSSETSLDSYSDTSSNSSSRHSSSGHSISDSLCDSPTAISTGPYRKRCRSPTSSVLVASPARGALSPVCADLLPSRKRIRDFDTVTDFEVSLEEGYMPYVPREADIDAYIMFADDIAARGMNIRLEDGTTAEEEDDYSARGTVDIEVDRVIHPVVSDDTAKTVREDFPDLELYDNMVEIPVHRIGVIESVQRDQGHSIVATSQ